MPAQPFDTTIDLLAQHLDAMGIPQSRSAEALAAVRASVSSMPGAGWVDVAYQGRIPESLLSAAGDRWMTLYRPLNAEPLGVGVPGYEALREAVAGRIRAGLEAVTRR